MSKVKLEADNGNDKKTCPPGMVLKDGDCVPSGNDTNESKKKIEEDNAGTTSDKGEPTLVDASETPNPPELHECPPGSTWNNDTGLCEPATNAGDVGAGTAAGATSGKELSEQRKWFETMMAQYAFYFKNQNEGFKNSQQQMLDTLSSHLGITQYKAESAAFGKKSSMVSDSAYKTAYESAVTGPANWFEQCRTGKMQSDYISWTINPEAYMATLPKGWMNYGSKDAHKPIKEGIDAKGEAFTISGGDMPQIFSKQVYLIPGGRMRVPIRQFLDTQIIEDADRFNWFKVNGFAFDGSTPEGSAATDESQTITKVTGTPALLRANQTVNYADIENAPFDLIEAFNRAAALGALDAEATDVLDTVYDAITPTNWVNGNTGGAFTDDDVASMTMKQEGLYAGKRLIENQGGDTSPGNLVFFAHPKAIEELVLDTAADFFTGQNALHSTALGVLENRLGVDIVVTNAVNATDNTTNDTFRNVLAMKGSIGLAVAADLQIEAQRRPDLSAVKVGARHRIKGAVIDETMTCRISTAQ